MHYKRLRYCLFCIKLLIMTNEEKAQKYNQMMIDYTRTQNQISSIKGESFEMNGKQLHEIKILEERLKMITRQASLL